MRACAALTATALLAACASIGCLPSDLPPPPAPPGFDEPGALDTGALHTGDSGSFDTGAAHTGDTGAGDAEPWFGPLSGTPNVLYVALDTQRRDALAANRDRLPEWFTGAGVDYPGLVTPSSYTRASAPWMLSGCDLRDGLSHTLADPDDIQQVLPEGCQTMADAYNERGYDLTRLQTFRDLEPLYRDMSTDDLATLRDAFACNYLADTADTADAIAATLEALKDAGHLDNAVVVLTSDHGELLLDYTDPAYPGDYADADYWIEHGNRLLPHETRSFSKVWFSGAPQTVSLDRAAGAPDLLQLTYHLSGADRDGLRGSLPWEAPQPAVQANLIEPYLLGVAWTDPETGSSWRYTAQTDGGDPRLFDLDADPGEADDRLGDVGLDPEIAELIDALVAQVDAG